jgi:alanine dehydrogenase
MSGVARSSAAHVGIRREDKSRWERRAPIIPMDAAQLARQHDVTVHVQPSQIRVFSEEEYLAAGAVVEESLSPCPVIFAVKEIPSSLLEPRKTYALFPHVIKGQYHNMPMLRRLMELGCTLIDYERVADEGGRRLIFFGRHAGIAGALETLKALGQRLAWEGMPTAFETLLHAYEYPDVEQAQADVARVGEAIRVGGIPEPLQPLIIGVAGYGNVARGAWEILSLLPIERIDPSEVIRSPQLHSDRSTIYGTTFREEHTVEPVSKAEDFDLHNYYTNPERYRATFERYVPYLTAIVNATYWEPRYPRLISKAYLRELYGEGTPSLRVIGDISCDIEGSMECTMRATTPDEPVFVYHPATDQITGGVAGDGVVVMAVDILPSELPRDASVEFSRSLKPFVPAIAHADYSQPVELLDLPPEIKRAVVVHQGRLTPDYAYLAEFLARQ